MPTSPRRHLANKGEIDRLVAVLANDPRSKVFLSLADEYAKAGMWQEATVILEDGLKVCPGFITAMVALGRAYDQLGQAGKAKVVLEEAVKLSPDNLRAHRTLAKIYTVEGTRDLAQRSCRAILEVNPQDEETLSLIRTLEQSAPTAPITPGLPAESSPQTVTVSQAAQTEELRTVTDSSDGPLAEQSSKVARLEAWLKKIQANREATA